MDLKQHYSSANTSINSAKLPAIYHRIDFSLLGTCSGLIVVDYGCGKFDNAKAFIEGMGGTWYGYDKYNRSERENEEALAILRSGFADCVICTNVLNVIDSDAEIALIATRLLESKSPYFVMVYEGDGTGVGKVSKKDCYQRNEPTKRYLELFPCAQIKHRVITNTPERVVR